MWVIKNVHFRKQMYGGSAAGVCTNSLVLMQTNIWKVKSNVFRTEICSIRYVTKVVYSLTLNAEPLLLMLSNKNSKLSLKMYA